MNKSLIDMTEEFAKQPAKDYERWLQPTIYIGLGGFGSNVVRTIKEISSKFLTKDLMNALGFIALDTHAFEPHDILTRNEYIGLSIGAVPGMLSKSNPESLGWYLDLTKKWAAPNINGANMVRAVGRLAFINPTAHDTFMNLLMKKHNKVSEFPGGTKLIVYIISSLAGGSGSGMLLDVLFSVREYFQDIRGGQIAIQAFLATPEPLENEAPSINLPNFYANTYAALKEMYYFFEGNSITLNYDIQRFQKLTASQEHLPDSTFIISSSNEEDMKIINDFEKLGHAISNYLLLEILTPLTGVTGAPEINRGENSMRYLEGNNDMLRAFSSIGIAKFGFPHAEVVEYFSYLILDYYLDKEVIFDKSFVKEKSQQWIIDNHISEFSNDELQNSLMATSDKKPFQIYLSIASDFEDVDREKLMPWANEFVKSKEQIIKRQLEKLLEDNFNNLINSVEDSFEETLLDLSKNYSIGSAAKFIEFCKEEIKVHQNALLQEMNKNKLALDNSREKVNNAISNIGLAADSNWFGRGDRISTAINSLQSEIQIYLNIIVKLGAQKKGIQFYKKIVDILEGEKNKYEGLMQILGSRDNYVESKFFELRNTLNMLSNKFERRLGNRFSFLQIQHINSIYKERFKQDVLDSIADRLKQELRNNNLLMNQTISDKQWVNNVNELLSKEIESRIEDLDVIDLLDKFYSGRDERNDLFSFLVSICAPLFPLNPSLKEQYQTVWIVACPDKIRERFLPLFRQHVPPNDGVQQASSKNKFEIIIYTIRHGYTLHSNSRISTYKSNYDNLQYRYENAIRRRIGIPPVHSWNGAWLWNEIIPSVEERDGKQYYILGRAFTYAFAPKKSDGTVNERRNNEFIYARGRFYYMRDQNNREIRLGDGLFEAIELFGSRSDFIDIIRERIDNKIQSVGAQNVKKMLVEYLNLFNSELEKASGERLRVLEELRDLLDSFIKSLDKAII